MTMSEIITQVGPTLVQFAAALIGILLTWILALVREKIGIEIEEKHREALHMALTSGAERLLSELLDGSIKPGAATERVVAHVKSSVKDAVSKLKASDKTLTRLAEAKIKRVMREAGGLAAPTK